MLRGVVVLVVVFALALPVAAEPQHDGSRRDLAKVVKTWLMQILGDGLIDPWP
jgi:hypothetical protein